MRARGAGLLVAVCVIGIALYFVFGRTPQPRVAVSPAPLAEHGPYLVVTARFSKTGSAFLNVGGDFPNQTFSVYIAKEYAPKFDVGSYAGKSIMVRGTIVDFKGKPEIAVTDPEQIRILK